MTKDRRPDALVLFARFTQMATDAELAALVREYMADSSHNNWDGHPARDLTAYRALFRDMMGFGGANESTLHKSVAAGVATKIMRVEDDAREEWEMR